MVLVSRPQGLSFEDLTDILGIVRDLSLTIPTSCMSGNKLLLLKIRKNMTQVSWGNSIPIIYYVKLTIESKTGLSGFSLKKR